ncbi:MAG: integrase [Flavobacteriales bacterium]|nr:integrase [Flavobacteriales bacterium]|tara:strand:- start:479 stop:1348 length:870 start_codon:yes stop_codon:yes gene_type:complete
MYIKDFIIFLSSEKRFSTHTTIAYKNDLLQFFNFLKNNNSINTDIQQISFKIIRNYVAFLLESDIKVSSVNRKISTLRSYFKFLVREDYLTINPMLKIIPPKSKKKLPVFVDQESMQSLLNEVSFPKGFIGERDKLIIELFYLTGIRLSELVNIKIKHISFDSYYVKVLGKRNKERIIPLSSKIIIEISSYISKYCLNEYLFTNLKKQRVYNKLVYRVVKKYISKISSIDKNSPHILRHTFATHMLNNGADINAIKELLGHANLSATQVYTHNTIDKLKIIYQQAHPRA